MVDIQLIDSSAQKRGKKLPSGSTCGQVSLLWQSPTDPYMTRRPPRVQLNR